MSSLRPSSLLPPSSPLSLSLSLSHYLRAPEPICRRWGRWCRFASEIASCVGAAQNPWAGIAAVRAPEPICRRGSRWCRFASEIASCVGAAQNPGPLLCRFASEMASCVGAAQIPPPQSRSAGGGPDGVASLLKLLPAWVRLKILCSSMRPRADLQEVWPMVSVRF